jgi:polyisoprenoid-binding protein YceI
MKIIQAIVAILVLGGLALIFWSPKDKVEETSITVTEEEIVTENEQRSNVVDGSYEVSVDNSNVTWSGKKPLIEGYINTGSMDLKSGLIEIDNGVITGEMLIDMNTLSVWDTPAKPGKEDMLESHLKGQGWFNVEEFPEAKFVLKEVTPQADVENTFMYDVKGDLTMKGETHELLFPALIYSDSADGLTHASASLEFDRTKWGITAGSGSVFDNLADNVVDDMVALSFTLVAEIN